MIRMSQVGASATAFLFLRDGIPSPISVTKSGDEVDSDGGEEVDQSRLASLDETAPHRFARVTARGLRVVDGTLPRSIASCSPIQLRLFPPWKRQCDEGRRPDQARSDGFRRHWRHWRRYEGYSSG